MRVENEVDEITNLRHVNEINSFEKGLVDNGYVIIKFFLHISKKEMRKRQEKLSRKKSTQWRVTEKDRRMLHEYKTYYQAFDSMLESTNRPYAQWHVISGSDKETAILEIFQIMIDEVTKALKLKEERDRSASSLSAVIDPGQYNFVSMPLLKDVDMNKSLEEDEYRILLKREQKRLKENHNRLYLHRVPMIIAYEGWGAAGKAGNIKRISGVNILCDTLTAPGEVDVGGICASEKNAGLVLDLFIAVGCHFDLDVRIRSLKIRYHFFKELHSVLFGELVHEFDRYLVAACRCCCLIAAFCCRFCFACCFRLSRGIP